jgi:hypothetical protein
LVGGEPYSYDLAKAYYVAVDLDKDRVDIAGHVLEDVIEEQKEKRAEAEAVAARLREALKRITPLRSA